MERMRWLPLEYKCLNIQKTPVQLIYIIPLRGGKDFNLKNEKDYLSWISNGPYQD